MHNTRPLYVRPLADAERHALEDSAGPAPFATVIEYCWCDALSTEAVLSSCNR